MTTETPTLTPPTWNAILPGILKDIQACPDRTTSLYLGPAEAQALCDYLGKDSAHNLWLYLDGKEQLVQVMPTGWAGHLVTKTAKYQMIGTLHRPRQKQTPIDPRDDSPHVEIMLPLKVRLLNAINSADDDRHEQCLKWLDLLAKAKQLDL